MCVCKRKIKISVQSTVQDDCFCLVSGKVITAVDRVIDTIYVRTLESEWDLKLLDKLD